MAVHSARRASGRRGPVRGRRRRHPEASRAPRRSPITENRATGFDGSGNPTGWQAWLTAYTPTGKVASTTDPLGHTTSTGYDALDRPNQVTDASGRVTGKTYDLAGQELTQVRGVGTPLIQSYATFAWWPDGEKKSVRDANGNTINLAYDGFNRISQITHPDTTTELSFYDPDGDLTVWTNRGGFSIVRCWDVLNRKVSETGYTGATNSGACPSLTGGTYNQVARGWDAFPANFTYDLAGRLTGATSSRLAISYGYDAAGRPTGRGGGWTTSYGWDGAGNMTSVTYPEGSVFTYQYDALNRTTAALQGATTLASLTYDPLGRRGVLTFHDASTETWGYDGADRLVTLAHAFPTASDNVSLGYGYDPADRELSKTTSNAAYVWSPAVASTAYAAANALNQYPSVASYPYTYWPEGPLEQTDTLKAYHDEENRFAFAFITPTPGVVDTNNYVQNVLDPMGHLMFHDRHPAAGVPYPYFYHSTDGLRPETVLDWQYSQPTTGQPIFQGYRRYVLGPDPDERWAFLDFDAGNTIYYPHTDRQGTTIALSAGGAAVQKYQYDAFGQSTNTLTEIGPGAASYAFRYTGQRLDGGTGFYDYKARFYSSALGRFLQPDQAGLDQGPNLYLYVQNDPVNKADPTGRQEEEMEPEAPIREVLEAGRGEEERNELREVNPAYRLEESAERGAIRLQHYDIFGRGNISGRSQDVAGSSLDPLAQRIQSTMGSTSYGGALRNGEGYQFSGVGGRAGAEGAFRMIAGRSPSGSQETFRSSIGDTKVSVNIHQSTGQGGDPAFRGATTVEIRTSTEVTGSRIPVQTYVKLRYPDQ